METKPDSLETARVSFMVPPDQGASPTWHDLGDVEIETSLGLGHGAFELSAWSIPDAALLDLVAFDRDPLIWRIVKSSGGTFEGAFWAQDLKEPSADGETPFSISLVARSPIIPKAEKDPEPETVTRIEPGKRPGADELVGAEPFNRDAAIESLAGKANVAASTMLHSLIKTRVPELAFSDAFAAVITGGLDAIVRILAAATPDEEVTADAIKVTVAEVLEGIIQSVVAERLLAIATGPEQ